MKIQHLPNAIRKDYYTISVAFQGSRSVGLYTYKCHESVKLESTDEVIVPTRYGIKLATVIAVHDQPEIDYEFPHTYNWIVQKLDKSLMLKLEKQDRDIIEEGKMCEVVNKRKAAMKEYRKSLGTKFLESIQEKLKF